MRAINTAGDGTIFLNCLKPAGKVLNHLKGKGVPPTVTVSAAAVAMVGCIGYYCYKKFRSNSS